MNTFLVHCRGVRHQVEAAGHKEAARNAVAASQCGHVSHGETLWVDGPMDERAPHRATIHFTATAHRPPHLRQGLTYRYG